jgi:CspA family cold shock protein
MFLKKLTNLFRRTQKMKQTGKVKWYNSNKGYGFISLDNGKEDIFIHSSAVKAARLDTLDENQKLEFEIEEKEGKTSAINIKKVND